MNKILIAFLTLLSYSELFSQWSSRNFPLTTVTDVDVVSNNLAYALSYSTITDESVLYRVADGKTYTPLQSSKKIRFYGCHFFDSQNGLVCGETNTKLTTIWRTADGGATLNEITVLPFDLLKVNDFSFVNNSIGYFFTASQDYGSKIYQTLDGGSSWKVINVEETTRVFDLKFLSPTTGYRLSSDGLEISRDSAKNWQLINTPVGVQSFYFLSEQVGFIGTYNGELFKTENGGATWQSMLKLPPSYITNIKFPSISTGYITVGTYQEYVFRTTDGGTTWKRVFETETELNILDKLDFFDENTLFAFGTGLIAFTNNGATANDIKKSTLLVSGRDTSCNTSMPIRFDLTGNAPWDIVLQDIKGVKHNFTATQTPFVTSFKPSPLPNEEYELTPLSIKGAGESVSNFTGGKAIHIPIPLDASFKGERQQTDTVCINTKLDYAIQLKGCAPWSIIVRYNERDSLIENIQNPEYIFSASFQYEQQISQGAFVSIKGVKSRDGDWKYYTRDEERRERFVYLKAPISSVESSATINQNSICDDTDVDFNIFFKGLPPFKATFTNGKYSVNVQTSNFMTEVQVPIKGSATWFFTNATDGCGDIINKIPNNITPRVTPKVPTNVQYNYTIEGDSIDVKWQEEIISSETIIKIANQEVPIGAQKARISVYDFFLYNKDSAALTVDMTIGFMGCSVSSTPIILPSKLRTVKRNHFTQLPPNSGVVLADMNGDKLPDVLAANGFYINKGGFQFEYRAQNFGGNPSVIGDLDNDGDLDFLVNNETEGTTKIYYNNPNFIFTLKQSIEGVNATLFDYDFNGLLDIVATGKLYKNAGDNRYINLPYFSTHGHIIGKPYYFDYEGDGLVDLVDVYNIPEEFNKMAFRVIGYDTTNNYWKKIDDIESADYIAIPKAISWGDMKATKGYEDFAVFCAPYFSEYQTTINTAARPVTFFTKTSDIPGYISSIFGSFNQNDLKGHGEGLLLDINNDGPLDVIDTSLLNINNGILNVYYGGGQLGYISNGAPASADFDNDGDLDIAVALPEGGVDIFENKFDLGNKWLKVKLNARTINRYGLGVGIKIFLKGRNGQQRIIAYTVGVRHGGASRSDVIAHFGLDRTNVVDSIVVIWSPEKSTVLRGVQANQFLTIDEPLENIRPFYPIDLQLITKDDKQTLNWRDIATNEKGYIIQRSIVSSESDFVSIDTVEQNTTTFTTNKETGTAYYRVFAFNRAANSAFSNTVSSSNITNCQISVAVDTVFIAPEKYASSCEGQVLLSIPNLPNVKFQWTLEGKPIANASNPNFLAKNTGNYGLVLSNSAGCSRSLAPVKVDIGEPFKAEIKIVGGTSCVASTAALDIYPKGSEYEHLIEYRETPSVPWRVITAGQSYVADVAGQYRTATKSKKIGCINYSNVVDISLGSGLNAYILGGSSNYGCNEPVVFYNPFIDSTNILIKWYNQSDSLVSEKDSLILTKPIESGSYYLVAKDTVTGCEGKSDLVSAFLAQPKANYQVRESVSCLGNEGIIFVNPSETEIIWLEKRDLIETTSWEIFTENINTAKSLRVPSGIYRVISKTNLFDGCVDISPEIFINDSSFTINGKVTRPDDTPSVLSSVKILLKEDSGNFLEVSNLTTDDKGVFTYRSKKRGEYKVLATPSQATLKPTYFGNVTNLNQANSIIPTDCRIYLANIKLTILSPTNEKGDDNWDVKILNNPFSDNIQFNLVGRNSEKLNIELFSLNGVLLQKWGNNIATSATPVILYPNVSAGMYILKLKDNIGVIKTFKLIKL